MKGILTHRWLAWPLILMWLAIFAGMLAGCSTADTDRAIAEEKTRIEQQQAKADAAAKEIAVLRAAEQQAKADAAKLDASRNALAAELAELRDRAADTAEVEKKLAEAAAAAAKNEIVAAELKRQAEMQDKIRQQAELDRKIHEGVAAGLEKLRDAKTEPLRVAGETAQTVSGFLPPPWDAILAAIGGAAISGAGTRRVVRSALVPKLEAREELIGNLSVARAAGKIAIDSEHATAMKQLVSDAGAAELKEIENDPSWARLIAEAKKAASPPKS